MVDPSVPPPVSVDIIRAPRLPKPSARVRKLTEEEKRWYEVHTQGAEQDITERKSYARKIYRLTIGWFCALGLILALHGWEKYSGFEISERIILALITSATIEVIGLFVVVAKYLFPSTGRKH